MRTYDKRSTGLATRCRLHAHEWGRDSGGEQDRCALGDDQGVLVVRRDRAILREDGPTVGTLHHLAVADRDDGFDRDHETLGEPTLRLGVGPVRDHRLLVDRAADAVPLQLLDHREALAHDLVLDGAADVDRAATVACLAQPLLERALGARHEALRRLRDAAHADRDAGVGHVAVEFGGDVELHEVALGEPTALGRDAVHDLIVDRDARRARELIDELRCGARPRRLEHVRGDGVEFGGGDADETNYNRIRSLVNEELKQYFRPEFLNRLDEIIVFRQLNREEVKDIAEIMLREVFSRMQDKGIQLSVTDAFKERLVEEGYNPSYGARPLRRAVMRLLEDSLAEEFLSGRLGEGDAALVDVNDDKQVVIRKQTVNPVLPELAGASL